MTMDHNMMDPTKIEAAKADPRYEALVQKARYELIEKLKVYCGYAIGAEPSHEYAGEMVDRLISGERAELDDALYEGT